MIADPNNDSIFWYGGQNKTTYEMSVSKTTDNGLSWIRYTLNSGVGYAYTMVIDPTDSDIIYAGGYPRLYKTTDGGTNWSEHRIDTIFTLAIDPQQTSILYAGTPHGILKSTDNGENWTNTGGGEVNKLLINPLDPDIVYAASDSGVYKSTQGGGDWTVMNEGLDNTIINCLAINPDNYLYAGTDSAGIFRWPLGPGVEEEKLDLPKSNFVVKPNPFYRRTTIRYSLHSKSEVQLSVYDIQGRLVKDIISAVQSPGLHVARWRGFDNRDKLVPAGVYFCKLSIDKEILIEKLILLK